MVLNLPTDPLNLASGAPLLAAWLAERTRVAQGGFTPFTTPGHHYRTDLVGSVNADDLPMYGGVSSMKESPALLEAAEALAARAWGADLARFSVAGSTHGNQAAALAVARPGDSVIVSRTLHRSMLLGLVMADLHPVWVRPGVNSETGLPTGVPVAAVQAARAACPDAKAVFLGDPSYVGTMGDLEGLAAAAHRPSAQAPDGIPLVVDGAWAAHFGFHPDLPGHPLARGADALVISAHKALPAYSQAALLLANTARLDHSRLARGFEATHTTSPSGTILASIDAARELLVTHGERLLGQLLENVAALRDDLETIPGVRVLRGPDVDPTKVVVLLAETGAHGHQIEQDLLAQGLSLEMADRDVVIPLVTMADDTEQFRLLFKRLEASISARRGAPRAVVPSAAWSVDPEVVLQPKEAFFAPRVTVEAADAVGRVSAELIAPYPPGIPVIAPGERVTAEAIQTLRATLADGGRVAYSADPSLTTIQVVA